MILRETKKFTTKTGEPRKFYGCSRWPACKATHGAHPNGEPLGVPGDSATKAKRIETHRMMDKWKADLGLSKGAAYAKLKEDFGVEIHIAELDIVGCERLQEYFAVKGEGK